MIFNFRAILDVLPNMGGFVNRVHSRKLWCVYQFSLTIMIMPYGEIILLDMTVVKHEAIGMYMANVGVC